MACLSTMPSSAHASSIPLSLPPAPLQVMGVSFSPDSKRVVTASEDGTLRVWNIEVRYHMSEDPKVLLKVRGGEAGWQAG